MHMEAASKLQCNERISLLYPSLAQAVLARTVNNAIAADFLQLGGAS